MDDLLESSNGPEDLSTFLENPFFQKEAEKTGGQSAGFFIGPKS